MNKDNMFKTECEVCGKEMYTYAKNKQRELPKVYCSRMCESQAKYDKRFK